MRCPPSIHDASSPARISYLSRRNSAPMAVRTPTPRPTLRLRNRSMFVVDCAKRSSPASNSVGLAVPIDALLLLLTSYWSEFCPYAVLTSQFHPPTTPFAPTAPDRSLISVLMSGRKPSGQSARTVLFPSRTRQFAADSPSRVLAPPNAYSSTPPPVVYDVFTRPRTSFVAASPSRSVTRLGRSFRGSPAKY